MRAQRVFRKFSDQSAETHVLVIAKTFSYLLIYFLVSLCGSVICQKCPTLRPPPYGYLIRPCSNGVGDNCNIDCDIGFDIIGPSYRLCRRNGSWTGVETQCVKPSIQCPPIGSVSPNLIVKDCRNIAGGLCEFECSNHRFLHGPSRIYCRSDGRWSDQIPMCRGSGCSSPPEPPRNGAFVGECSSHIGSYCSYQCSSGYAIVGSPTIHCTASGHWSAPAPSCERLARFSSCPPLFPPENGSISGKCGPIVATDEECRFACDSGYRVDGETNLICKETGRWSSQPPTCKRNECPAINVPSGIITAGQCNPGSPGNSCMIYCSTGSTLSPPSIVTCGYDGHWTGALPMCISSQNCPSLSSPANGLATGQCSPGITGHVCNFVCASGYVLLGVGTVQCQSNGQWSSAPPVCTPLTGSAPSASHTSSAYSCSDLKAPVGGFYKSNMNCPKCPNICRGNANGDCTLFCGQGYQLTGRSATSFCNPNTLKWEPDPATCVSQTFSAFMAV